jgi:ATP-dependent helicase HrpA
MLDKNHKVCEDVEKITACISTVNAHLPICANFAEIETLLAQHQVILVAGETGSGKSTQLPQLCLHLGYAREGLIGHTQPRRIAAKSIASRVAEELKVSLGSVVGYQVRFNEACSEATQIKMMTDGILLAEIGRDPLLKRLSLIHI